MLFRQIIAENDMKPINTHSGHKEESLNVEAGYTWLTQLRNLACRVHSTQAELRREHTKQYVGSPSCSAQQYFDYGDFICLEVDSQRDSVAVVFQTLLF
jgi:hypothetical protein